MGFSVLSCSKFVNAELAPPVTVRILGFIKSSVTVQHEHFLLVGFPESCALCEGL